MKHKLKYSLDETILPIDFSPKESNDLTFFEQSEMELVPLEDVEPIEGIINSETSYTSLKSELQNNKISQLIFSRESSTTRRISGIIETRMDSDTS